MTSLASVRSHANAHLRRTPVSRPGLRFSHIVFVPLVALILLTGVDSATAQNVDIPAILSPSLKGPPTTLTVNYLHQFKADVEDAGTKIARDSLLLSGTRRLVKTDKVSFYGFGTYALTAYDFSHNNGTNYQWGNVNRFVLGGFVGYEINEKWDLIGGLYGRSWGEAGATFKDTLSGGLMGGFNYTANPDFSAGLIVGIVSGLENPVGLIPIPTMKWRFAEDWHWDIGMTSVGDPGIGSTLVWKFADDFSFGTGFSYQNRRYRLNDKTRINPVNNPADPSGRVDQGGVGQETEIPVFVSLRYLPTKLSIINLIGGVALNGNIRVEDHNGGRISDDDYDAALFLGLIGRVAF